MRDIEHNIQVTCVNRFRNDYPDLVGLLIAIPNGGKRPKVTAARLKAEGVVAGVSDMFLFVAAGGYHGLALEFKTEDGQQSPAQKAWQKAVEKQGFKYAIIHNFIEFDETIEAYLAGGSTELAILTGNSPRITKPVRRRRDVTLADFGVKD